MPNPVVHFEINGPDGAALARFYSDLFEWRVQEVPGAPYWLVDTQAGRGINGGIGTTPDGTAFATFYVESAEPEALMQKVEAAGGKVTMPVTETEIVTFGQFTDPDGLIVGIVKPGDPEEQSGQGPSAGDNPPVDWFEILGTDAARTQTFYRGVFGWEVENADFPAYGLVQHEHDEAGNDLSIGGGLGSGDGALWATVYARVPDCQATLSKAESLGGTRVYGPNQVGEGMRTGAFRDPPGCVFGVYQIG